MTDEPVSFDLSSETFDGFVEFFFARKVVSDDGQFELFFSDLQGRTHQFREALNPALLVEYMTRLFTNFAEIARRYSVMQIDQGLWGMMGSNFTLHELLWDETIDLEKRLDCIRSMFHVFGDFVAQSQIPDRSTYFFMWWDEVAKSLWWTPRPKIEEGDVAKLSTESRALLDAAFETLKSILEIPNTLTQRSALHGLGHLHHPGVQAAVQSYMDSGRSLLDPDELPWVEQCRDGKAL